MDKNSAVTPATNVFRVIQDLKNEAKEEVPSDKTEQRLAELYALPGFKDLKNYINGRIAYLRDQSRGQVEKDNLESIGLKSIIFDMVQDELNGVLERIERAYEENSKKA